MSAHIFILLTAGALLYATYEHGSKIQNKNYRRNRNYTTASAALATASSREIITDIEEVPCLPQISVIDGSVLPCLQTYKVTTSSGLTFDTNIKPKLGYPVLSL